MKKILSVLSFALVALAFVSCSKNSPEGVVKEYISCLKNGQYEDVVALCHFKKELTDKERQEYADLLRNKMAADLEKKGGISDVVITNVDMAEDGESATVSYTIKYGNGSAYGNADKVVKVDGKWKLHTGK